MNDPVQVDTATEVRAMLSQLKLTLDDQINYRLEKMFARLKGWGAKGEVKTKAQLVLQVEPTLRQLLLDGEEVLYVAKGIQQSIIESMFMGAMWANMINQTVFVLTNARLIMARCNGKGKPTETFWMIYYSEIDKFKKGWTGSINIKLKDGKKLAFAGFTKTDGKSMPAIFEEAVEQYRMSGFHPETSQSMENLCSHCYSRVPKNEFHCEDCGATFWKPSEVALRSLIFPSWGDFLLGHTVLAIFELLGYLLSWVVLVILPLMDDTPDIGEILVVALIVIAFEHCVDATITYFVARKGLHARGGPGTLKSDEAAATV